MRARKEIEKDSKQTQELILEVALDIRDLLIKSLKKKRTKKEDRKWREEYQ